MPGAAGPSWPPTRPRSTCKRLSFPHPSELIETVIPRRPTHPPFTPHSVAALVAAVVALLLGGVAVATGSLPVALAAAASTGVAIALAATDRLVIAPLLDELRSSRHDAAVAREAVALARVATKSLQQGYDTLATLATHHGRLLNPIRRTEAAGEKPPEGGSRLTPPALTRELLGHATPAAKNHRFLDLTPLLERIAARLRRRVGPAVRIDLHLESELPGIDGSPAQIRQVILSLALRSVAAMPHGGTLELASRLLELPADNGEGLPEGRYVEIAIADSGDGSTTESEGIAGHGLLATPLTVTAARGVVEAHGGRLDLFAEEGDGTTATLLFPVSDLSAAPSEPPPQPARGRILVVDDDADVRHLIDNILTRGGYRVLTAASGEAGVEQCRRHPGEIDLILVDVDLPEREGRHLLQELSRVSGKARVVVCRGPGASGLPVELEGVAGVLPKPFRIQEMTDTIRRLLDERA